MISTTWVGPGFFRVRGTSLVAGHNDDDFEIIAVVKDVKSESLHPDAPVTVDLPFRLNTGPPVTLHVRVRGNTIPVLSKLHELQTLKPESGGLQRHDHAGATRSQQSRWTA